MRRSILVTVQALLFAFYGCERPNIQSLIADLGGETPTLAPPFLGSPKDGAIITTTNRVRFRWGPVNGALHFNLEVSTNNNFSPVSHSILSDTTIFILDSLKETTHFWHVRGLGTGDLPGAWSVTRSFSVTPLQ